MKIKINKLFVHNTRPYASIRDYKIRECVKKGDSLTIIFRGDKMELEPHQVAFGFEQFTPDTFKSRTGGQNYQLWDFLWYPEKREDDLKKLCEMGVFG